MLMFCLLVKYLIFYTLFSSQVNSFNDNMNEHSEWNSHISFRARLPVPLTRKPCTTSRSMATLQVSNGYLAGLKQYLISR